MKYPIRYRMYTPILLALTIAAVVLRTVACFVARNEHGYFPGSSLPEISAWLLFGGCMFALTYPLFHRRPHVRAQVYQSSGAIVPTALLAVAQALLCADILRTLIAQGSLHAISRPQSLWPILLFLTALTGLMGLAYFVLSLAFREDCDRSRVLPGLSAVFFCLLYATLLYFDQSTPINATCKLTSQVAFISMGLYLLCELRVSLGRPAYGMQVALAFISASLASYAALPSVITYVVTGDVIDRSIFETLFTLLFICYAVMRLYTLCRLGADEQSPIALAIDAPPAVAVDVDELATTEPHTDETVVAQPATTDEAENTAASEDDE